jgi:hypothetical protein
MKLFVTIFIYFIWILEKISRLVRNILTTEKYPRVLLCKLLLYISDVKRIITCDVLLTLLYARNYFMIYPKK